MKVTGACGKLKAYANCSENRTENTSYYCGAGIGSRGYVEGGSIDSKGKISVTDNETLYYLTIAGGNIEARGSAGSRASGGGAGIGSGSACASNVTGSAIEGLNITGGYIDAWGGDNSAACVGGGYRSNYVHVNIYGGTVNATNRTAGIWNEIRGAGIGAGGGGTSSGSPSVAKVKIYGGTVTASSTYGAGIGGAGGGDGGGSYTEVQSNSQSASVEITGGTITATSNGNGAAIGTGGPLGMAAKGSAGKADVTISGGTIEASSESGADIGGGGVVSSVADSSGGGADIRISGGIVTAAKGGIGGGKANAGTGGDANVSISRGYVKAPSIGGGDSTTNQGGSASITVENAALVELTGGIGGGNSTLSENNRKWRIRQCHGYRRYTEYPGESRRRFQCRKWKRRQRVCFDQRRHSDLRIHWRRGHHQRNSWFRYGPEAGYRDRKRRKCGILWRGDFRRKDHNRNDRPRYQLGRKLDWFRLCPYQWRNDSGAVPSGKYSRG